MPRASLVVQDFSYGFVRRFVDYLHGVMQRHLDPHAGLLICHQVDAAAYPDGLVFLIGENFAPFERRKGCTYALLNLSVVSPLGSPFAASLAGHRQVFRKRRMLAGKLPLIDALLDYYPPQTKRLKHSLSLPVFGFDVAVAAASDRQPDPDYDVCFVGAMTARRQRVLDDLKARGVRLSPSHGGPIEKFAAQSALCLNIHTERSNHLEVPRFAAALSTGCPVVTETSFGVADLGAQDFVIERPLPQVADAVTALLGDKSRLERLQRDSLSWYKAHYLPRADARWRDVFEQATTLHDNRSAPAVGSSLRH
ncbi:MAG: hypothetical protein AAGM21_07835 [Pseudomonadota bacterium]